MDNLFFATIPLIALLTCLLFKWGAITSSIVGSVVALVIIFFSEHYALNFDSVLATDLPIVLLLTASAALVIIPGQIFNSLLQTAGTIKEIGTRMQSVRLSPLRMASVIVLGIAPTLESMTGFGVSLFFTVPVLLQLFSLRKALLLSLLSMNIMPWGTLALATLIGGQLSSLPFGELAVMTSLTSVAVFPTIGLLIFLICRERGTRLFAGLLYPLLSGIVLSCCLIFYNRYTTPELAGVYSGLTTTILVLLGSVWRDGKGLLSEFIQARPSLLRLFAPYLLLIALIGISRISVIYDALQNFLSLQSGGVQLFVLTSPGICIFASIILVTVFFGKYRQHPRVFYQGMQRSVYPVAGIMMFVLFAQLHRASGIFSDIAMRMLNLTLAEITFISPLLGMFSGYATGSNVGGNALFMALQSETGSHFQQQLVFAALQNSSSGHTIFMSLPIILLALSIAKSNSQDAYAQQAWLVRYTLLCAPFIYVALVVPFYWLVNF